MSDTITATWITKDNEKIIADVPVGQTLMHAALANNVPDILGECGGALACGTCRVVVEYAPVPLQERSRPNPRCWNSPTLPPQES